MTDASGRMATEAVPDWAELAAALGRRLPPDVAPAFDPAFLRSSVRYEAFVYRLALAVLRESGLAAALAEPGTAAELVARAGLDPRPALVPIDWLLRYLAGHRAVEPAGSGEPRRYRLAGPLPALDPGAVRDEQRADDPSWLPAYVLAETVAGDYPAFLRGTVAGEEVLFSPRRFRLWVEYFSNANSLYAVNNRVGALAVTRWLPAGAVAIVELGGGLASGAAAVLDALAADGRLASVREYRFTEIVPAFRRRGEEVLRARFPGAAFLTSGRVDMNEPLAPQGILPESASLVYAVNTLHVAHDLDATLREIYRALRPGGVLVASECIRPWPGQAIYVEFVFNLMETFRAPRLAPPHRPNGGFLTPEQWRGALEAAGFSDVRFLPDIVALRAEFPTFYVSAIAASRPG